MKGWEEHMLFSGKLALDAPALVRRLSQFFSPTELALCEVVYSKAWELGAQNEDLPGRTSDSFAPPSARIVSLLLEDQPTPSLPDICMAVLMPTKLRLNDDLLSDVRESFPCDNTDPQSLEFIQQAYLLDRMRHLHLNADIHKASDALLPEVRFIITTSNTRGGLYRKICSLHDKLFSP